MENKNKKYIDLQHADIVALGSGILIIPVDGAGPGLEGSLGRQLARRYPSITALFKSKVQYPIAYGKTALLHCDESCPFRYIMLASLLNHINDLSQAELKGMVYNVVLQTLKIALGFEITTVSSVVLRAGWRLNYDTAFLAMLDAYESQMPQSKKISFTIFESDKNRFDRISALARSLQWI